jgi:hypothetical protein
MAEKREYFVNRLRNYYYHPDQKIGADDFDCRYKNKCKVTVYRGAEAYVGEEYGEPFKVLVASLDLGNAKANLEERFRQIKDLKEGNLNLHMKGTLETLKVIFSDEVKTKEATELFKNFAMTNTAKCCRGTNMSQAPWGFFNRCKEYTKGEIEILQPDIIITQGRCTAEIFALLYPKLKSKNEWYEWKGEITLNGHKSLVVCSVHPSARGKWRKKWQSFFNKRLPSIINERRRCLR